MAAALDRSANQQPLSMARPFRTLKTTYKSDRSEAVSQLEGWFGTLWECGVCGSSAVRRRQQGAGHGKRGEFERKRPDVAEIERMIDRIHWIKSLEPWVPASWSIDRLGMGPSC